MVNSTEPTVTVSKVDDASLAATSTWPPGLPRPNNLFDKIKYDTAFAGVPTDVRTKEKVKPLPVERLGKDWDRKRKERLQKERNAKGKKSYVIPKLGSTSASQGVGSTPTPALPLSTPAPASESPAAEVTPTTKDIINRATKDIISKAGKNTARPYKEIPVSKAPPPSTRNTVSTVGSNPALSARKETGARKKEKQVVKPPGTAPARKLLVPDHLPDIILPDMSKPPPAIKGLSIDNVIVPNFAPPQIK